MESNFRILVVVDPTQDTHPSIERALALSSHAKQSPAAPLQRDTELVFLLLATEQTQKTDALTKLTTTDDWINEKIHKPVSDLGLKHSIQISWSKSWANTLLELETRESIDLTIISFYGSGKTLSEDNWKLLRDSSKPILIAQDKKYELSGQLLASIKTQDISYSDRNQNVINGGRILCETYGCDLHVVNAYSDSLEFPDRVKVAALAGVPNERVHVKVGEPQTVICDIANEINADAVLISTHRRKGLQGMLRGNTVEKIIAGVGRDVYML